VCLTATAVIVAFVGWGIVGVAGAKADPASYRAAVLADHPAAYYQLDETSGLVAADAVGAHNGAYSATGVTLGQPGAIPGGMPPDLAASFDGVTGNVSIPEAAPLQLNGTGAPVTFSIEFWAKLNAPPPASAGTTTFPAIINQGNPQTPDGYLVWYDSTGNLHFVRNGTVNATRAITTRVPLSTSVFHHYVLTFDGTTARWYEDGTPDLGATGSTGQTIPANTSVAPITLATDGTFFANATLDEVAVYNTTLSAARVAAHFAAAAQVPGGHAETGYRLFAGDGGVFTFGTAKFFGSTANLHLNAPVVAAAATPSGLGYWLFAADGGVFTFGDAKFFGSTGNLKLNAPVIAAAPTPSGQGYWLVASDGGIFNFGDAKFFGSTGNLRLNRPIVGMAATPTGQGYWLVASDGGIFTFGDAAFFGSTGNLVLNRPVIGMLATPDGAGYGMYASDGGLFTFGDFAFLGSTGALHLNAPVIAASL
jgi:hypothetical protein